MAFWREAKESSTLIDFLYRVSSSSVAMYASATMASLAAMDLQTVAMHHQNSKGDNIWGLKRFGLTFDDYQSHLELTRQRGFGTRLVNYLGETVVEDHLSAIGVTVHQNDRPIGAITMLWPRVHENATNFASEYLAELTKTANDIFQALSTHSPSP